MFIKYFNTCFIVMIMAFTFSGCIHKSVPTPDEAVQYMQKVHSYCEEQGYELIGYAGKTIIKSKVDMNAANPPVVYEWETKNKYNKKKYYVRIGPIFSNFKNFKPIITVSEKRYALQK